MSPLRHSGYSSAGLEGFNRNDFSGGSHDCDSSSGTSISERESDIIQIMVEWTDKQGYKQRIPHSVWVEQYKSTLPDFQNKCAWCQILYDESSPFSCECNSYIFCQIECYAKFAKATDHGCQAR